ncbi:hypothetical protein E2542_SST23499 [Spatholobus suberectus]|nr:hypothetical protein E2542_SST23499 [Spatholobus suberectus]
MLYGHVYREHPCTLTTRNKMVFPGKLMTTQDVTESAKLYAWKWLRARKKGIILAHKSACVSWEYNNLKIAATGEGDR